MDKWYLMQELLRKIQVCAGSVLKIPKDKLDAKENLSYFGFDSVTLAEFADKMSQELKLAITPDIFFAYPTFHKIVEYVIAEYGDELMAEESSVPEPPKANVKPTKQIQIRHTALKKYASGRRRSRRQDERIAIIGMSGRFPGAVDIEGLWEILEQGRCEIKSPAKANRAGWRKDQKIGYLDDIDKFDPFFFGISPIEARQMDPRQRLLLEEAWKAMEDAGLGAKQLDQSVVAMYVGAEDGDYTLLNNGHGGELGGNHNGIMAARISYLLNFKGPNMAINTACSSGLVAIHQACQSIKNGECDTAIVAGVNLLITPDGYISMENSGMISPTHVCKAFSDAADGMVPAEAVGVVILTKESTARKFGNRIYAYISGSGINYDGKTNGITAPSRTAQSQLLQSVYKESNIDINRVDYIVTHGTATKLGDPIEINALIDAMGENNETDHRCAITSTKSNIGHTLAASGVVSLISLVMALWKEMIPASIHCEPGNKYINWDDGRIYVNKENLSWPCKEVQKRIGGVSAFGMSGTNAHVIVESAGSERIETMKRKKAVTYPAYLIVFSGKTSKALLNKKQQILELIEKQEVDNQDLSSFSYTLLEGRHHFSHRFAMVVRDTKEAVSVLESSIRGEHPLEAFEEAVSKQFTPQRPLQQMVDELINKSETRQNDVQGYREILLSIAECYCTGYEINARTIFGSPCPTFMTAPQYTFEDERFWIDDTNDPGEQNHGHWDQMEGNAEPQCNEQPKGTNTRQLICRDMQDIISMHLHISKEKLDIYTNLAEFGYDSISLTDLAARFSEHFHELLTPDIFFGFPSIDKLAGYLLEKDKGNIASIYGIEGGGSKLYIPLSANNNAPVKDNHDLSMSIIGMSGRFPGSDNIDELWVILQEGKEAIEQMPSERISWWKTYNHGVKAGVNRGRLGFVKGIDEFEPQFFEISPREALTMDPRQRLLLQESWRALEDAGVGREALEQERVGMFVGVEEGDYSYLTEGGGSITSNHNAVLAARLSYLLNLSGPNMAINTACSSSMTALHQACMSLNNDECDIAIVAGLNLMTTGLAYQGMEQAGMLSEDGRCYAFDKRANGMVPAEAVVAVVLKKEEKANLDKNSIYATIVGSGLNYDGRTNGITAPNRTAQSRLISNIYKKYRINPESIGYVVTHGTGTRLGDPVEINALNDAFAEFTDKTKYCAVTSCKSNLGHALAASGLVSLVSLILAFKNSTIPASINCSEQSDYVQWETSPFYLNRKSRDWPVKEGSVRYGAVSSFGMSGTNSHMVIKGPEASIGTRIEQNLKPYYLIPVSAKTKESLGGNIDDLLSYLQRERLNDDDLMDISYTLLSGRHHFKYRAVFLVKDMSQLLAALGDMMQDDNSQYMKMGVVENLFTEDADERAKIEEILFCLNNEGIDSNEYLERMKTLSQLYCKGYTIDGDRLFSAAQTTLRHLPSYHFNVKNYWTDCIVCDEGTKTGKEFHRMVNVDNSKKSFDQDKLFDELSGLLAEELYIEKDQIETGKTFTELGLDSIIGVEWIRKINKRFDLEISTTRIYQFPTLFEFTKYIMSMMQKESSADPLNNTQNEPKSDEKKTKKITLSDLNTNKTALNNQCDSAMVVESPVLKQPIPIASQSHQDSLRQELTKMLAEELFLKPEEIEVTMSFVELGMDSIISVEWIRKVNKKYGQKLSATVVYQFSSLEAFSEHLSSLMNQISVINETKSVEQVLNDVYTGKISVEEAEELISSM